MNQEGIGMLRMGHIAIVVKDTERSKKFYSEVLNAKVIGTNENDRLKFLYLEIDGQTIELLQYHNSEEGIRPRGAIDHIAFFVDDIENEIKRLKKLNVTLLFDSPKEVNSMRIMFFEGPDGERIEFMEE